MTTDDLSRVMREHSEHDRLPPGPALRDRITRRRRQRFAGTAVVAAALVLAVAAPLMLIRGGGTGVVDPPAGSAWGRPADAAERTPAEYTDGYRLAASRDAVLPAENTFSYTFTPVSYDFRLMLWCDSVWGSRLRAFIGTKEVVTDYCEPAGKRLRIGPFEHSEPISLKKQIWEDGYGVRVGEPVTVTVRVHTGRDEHPDPEPPTAAGVARLLVYLPVTFAEYPFPPPPKVLPRISDPPLEYGEQELNRRDAYELSTTQNAPINNEYAFSVTRQPGRDIRIRVDVRGPGTLRIMVDQRIEVMFLEFWDWIGIGYEFRIEPGHLQLGRSTVVSVAAEGFTAPVWRVTALDVPA